MTYQEFVSYSPFHDAEMARISMCDSLGQEYWMMIPVQSGKAYREARNTAIEAIVTAIESNQAPGEVRTQ